MTEKKNTDGLGRPEKYTGADKRTRGSYMMTRKLQEELNDVAKNIGDIRAFVSMDETSYSRSDLLSDMAEAISAFNKSVLVDIAEKAREGMESRRSGEETVKPSECNIPLSSGERISAVVNQIVKRKK